MTIEDYDEVSALWQITSRRALSAADERAPMERYLARNAGLSQVALGEDGAIVGTALCGHDGRRGYLYHMAVRPAWRRQGVCRAMAEAALKALEREGIDKCHIFVFRDNQPGQSAWEALGWQRRSDVFVYSIDTPNGRKEAGI